MKRRNRTRETLMALASIVAFNVLTPSGVFASGHARPQPQSPAGDVISSPEPSPIPSTEDQETPQQSKAKAGEKNSEKNIKKKPKSDLPKLLLEIEEKYSESLTISANFSQTTDDKTLAQKKTSSGKLFVKRPAKMRWETLKPDPSLLVSDGEHFWFYTPPFDEGEHGQLIEKKSNEVQSQLANALLSGEFSKLKGIKVKDQGNSTFEIKPKSGTAGTVIQAQIKIDPKLKLIEKVILNHKGGNSSEITLTQIELGKPLKDSTFTFQAPPNTDLVKE